ncbi:MAG: thermonuclease family protein [Nitrospiraceae bacterium]|nr:MAG: thermonuclease family protein [Nitrospiraceae bacterium]
MFLNKYTTAALSSVIFFFLVSGMISCSAQSPLKGEVIRVTDGDTVVIAIEKGDRDITCRLYGIDSPEKPTRDRRGQPYSKEAGQELKQLVFAQNVEVITTGEKTHGREVCIIKKDGMDINLEMVRRGYAWAYRKHLKSPYASAYIEAEKKARVQGLGIWQESNPLPPWEFKRRHWRK